jgi:hypothetical protein
VNVANPNEVELATQVTISNFFGNGILTINAVNSVGTAINTLGDTHKVLRISIGNTTIPQIQIQGFMTTETTSTQSGLMVSAGTSSRVFVRWCSFVGNGCGYGVRLIQTSASLEVWHCEVSNTSDTAVFSQGTILSALDISGTNNVVAFGAGQGGILSIRGASSTIQATTRILTLSGGLVIDHNGIPFSQIVGGGTPTILTTGQDLNTLLGTAFYTLSASLFPTIINLPPTATQGQATILTEGFSNDNTKQTYTILGSATGQSNRIWTRTSSGGGTLWSDWVEILSDNNGIRYDTAQSLTTTQQAQVRANIGVGTGGALPRMVQGQFGSAASGVVNLPFMPRYVIVSFMTGCIFQNQDIGQDTRQAFFNDHTGSSSIRFDQSGAWFSVAVSIDGRLGFSWNVSGNAIGTYNGIAYFAFE